MYLFIKTLAFILFMIYTEYDKNSKQKGLNMMFCKSCGAEISSDCVRCSQCGNNPYDETGVRIERDSVVYTDKTKYKSRIIAGILQILLPFFAAGRLYLGNYYIAGFQIFLSFVLQYRIPFTWIFIPVGVIIPIIDGIRILQKRVLFDANGNKLK